MQERRKIGRKHLAVYSRVYDRCSGRALGYLADLSELGAMIISDESLPENCVINLRFDLPDSTLFAASYLDMRARAAWFSPDVYPAYYNIGFEFLNASPGDVKILAKMINAYEFKRARVEYPPTPSFL